MKYGQVAKSKIYFSISEVAERTGVAAHVLRFWESAIPLLRPMKNRAGNRAYREKDIELVLHIKQLVYVEKYTLDGAQKRLKGLKGGELEMKDAATKIASCEGARKRVDPGILLGLHAELQQALAMLKAPSEFH